MTCLKMNIEAHCTDEIKYVSFMQYKPVHTMYLYETFVYDVYYRGSDKLTNFSVLMNITDTDLCLPMYIMY